MEVWHHACACGDGILYATLQKVCDTREKTSILSQWGSFAVETVIRSMCERLFSTQRQYRTPFLYLACSGSIFPPICAPTYTTDTSEEKTHLSTVEHSGLPFGHVRERVAISAGLAGKKHGQLLLEQERTHQIQGKHKMDASTKSRAGGTTKNNVQVNLEKLKKFIHSLGG